MIKHPFLNAILSFFVLSSAFAVTGKECAASLGKEAANTLMLDSHLDPVLINWEYLKKMITDLEAEKDDLFAGTVFKGDEQPVGITGVKAVLEILKDGLRAGQGNANEKVISALEEDSAFVEKALMVIAEGVIELKNFRERRQDALLDMEPTRGQLAEDSMGLMSRKEVSLVYSTHDLIQDVKKRLKKFAELQHVTLEQGRSFTQLIRGAPSLASIFTRKTKQIEARMIKTVFDAAHAGQREILLRNILMISYLKPLSLKDNFGVTLEEYGRGRRPIEEVFDLFRQNPN